MIEIILTFVAVAIAIALALMVFLFLASRISGTPITSITKSPMITTLAKREPEKWTKAELDLPGVDPRRTDITKAQQVSLAREGRLVKRTMLVSRRFPGLTVDVEPEVVNGEVMPDDAPQLSARNPQRERLLPRSERSNRLLGG